MCINKCINSLSYPTPTVTHLSILVTSTNINIKIVTILIKPINYRLCQVVLTVSTMTTTVNYNEVL